MTGEAQTLASSENRPSRDRRSTMPRTLPVGLTEHSVNRCAAADSDGGASFLRHRGTPGLAEREMSRSILNAYDRVEAAIRVVPQFTRHRALLTSVFAGVFRFASRLGEVYWTAPIQQRTLDRAWEHA